MTDIQYAPAVGNKFYEDGRVRQFAGNTVICFADPAGQAYRLAEWTQQEILKQDYGHKLSMLPPTSFHMTVFELVCDDVRVASNWSEHLALDAPLEETDAFFIDAFAKVPVPDNFQMRFTGLNLGRMGLSLYLEPTDEAMNQAIRGYRDALSEATGIRFANHETYAFHLSLAYRIIQLSDAEEEHLQTVTKKHIEKHLHEAFGVFDTGQPRLTFFDNMFAFVPTDERHTLQSRS